MKKVYLIGNAHLDPVWLWRKQEGLSEILSTFRSALDRMNEFPDYVFTSACAGYYKWIEQTDKKMFEEIKNRIKEERWNIAGGFWVQPDCNLPSGESFARHVLYSQRYFKGKFGITAKTGYNVDSFGHSRVIPQILRKAGIENYVFMRPNNEEKTDFPSNLFMWESNDGSRVTACLPVLGYSDLYWGCPEGLEPCSTKVQRLLNLNGKDEMPYMSFYGIGNHGGGPTIRGLQALTSIRENNEDVVFSSIDRYFDDIKKSGINESLPVVKEDLQHHASGCYSANSAIKKANRKAENAIVAAEKYDFLAHLLLNESCHNKEIYSAWEKIMFNQFHDILAGCSIKEAYDEAISAYGFVIETANDIKSLALQKLAWNIKTTDILDESPQKNGWILWEKSGEGAPIVVFNPHSFDISEPVQLNIKVSCVKDNFGQTVPIQTVRGSQTNGEDRHNTIFPANVPSYGYRVYFVFKDSAIQEKNDLCVSEYVLENEVLKIEFDEHTGVVKSFFDKENNKELSCGSLAKPILIDDYKSDTWAHNIFKFDEEVGIFTDAEIQITERGPVRCAIRVKSRYGNSELIQDFSLAAGKKRLDCKCKLNMLEKHCILKLSFPINLENPQVIYSAPYGFINKKADGLEEPAHEWVIGEKEGYGLALLNDCKYSFSMEKNDLRMIAARTAIYADHYGVRDGLEEYMDMGEMAFSYSLMVFEDNISDITGEANLLNIPPELILGTHHQGPLPTSFSGLSISEKNISAGAIKMSEDEIGCIMRVYETSGKETSSEISFNNIKFTASFKPQEIKTYLIHSRDIKEVNLVEWI